MSTTVKLIFVLAASIIFLACSTDEDPQVKPITHPILAGFTQSKISMEESDVPREISISFTKPATRDGVIFVKVNAEKQHGFTTSPAIEGGQIELPVTAGQASVGFTFTPINDDISTEPNAIEFTIVAASDGFMVGTEKILSLTLTDDESPAQVNFMLNMGTARENSRGSTVMIAFSHPAPGSGSIEVSFTSANAVYGTHFTTQPEVLDGKIKLPVEAGANHVSFLVIPVNDQVYNSTRVIDYTISQVQGALTKGDGSVHQLSITDDELEGRNKAYTVIAGNWSITKSYEYNEDGLISKIFWEQNTPYHSEGTYLYHYNQEGQVIKKVESALVETIYTWQDGRIIKAEKYNEGVLKQYTLYGYDDAGNIGESAIHDRQQNGEFKLSLLFVYLYNLDGNIYKQLTYTPIAGAEEYSLISTRTYDNYLNKENPFAMVEILPNINSQPNLPGSYRVEENGHNILYQFTYEFGLDGRPTKRTATSSSGSEVAFYEYY